MASRPRPTIIGQLFIDCMELEEKLTNAASDSEKLRRSTNSLIELASSLDTRQPAFFRGYMTDWAVHVGRLPTRGQGISPVALGEKGHPRCSRGPGEDGPAHDQGRNQSRGAHTAETLPNLEALFRRK